MRGQWHLTEQEKEKYVPYIEGLIKELREGVADSFGLTDTTLNPMNMKEIMEILGYEQVNLDTNGWEGDFWYTYDKPGSDPRVIVGGDCVTCDLSIYLED